MNKISKFENFDFKKAFRFFSVSLCLCGLIFLSTSCSEPEKSETENFYADSKPPAIQELRWTNGSTPKSFDPALASAPPETDIVRALYDGLTETNPNSLEAVPAIAEKWSHTDDFKTWTFHLRKDAEWSNGKKITAQDFVKSWMRLAEMGDEVSHFEIIKNIVGVEKEIIEDTQKTSADSAKQMNLQIFKDNTDKKLELPSLNSNTSTGIKPNEIPSPSPLPMPIVKKKIPEKIGVEAIDDYTLKVKLIKPDKEFPKLVAHPIFRPVYANGAEFENKKLNPKIITSGAFHILSVAENGIGLEKSKNYYNQANIKLQRVRFVPTKDADSALQAYRRGEVDIVTNAEFEPLALKLLLPFYDFQRTTHSALNFYEFNIKNPPFNDRRVREAMSISIERERLTEDDTKGATKPALTYLPFDKENKKVKFSFNLDKSRELLRKSGYPNGENFPTVRLVVNRNDLQQKIADSVAKMWKENLNIDTEIIIKESDEIEEFRKGNDFDVIRRGVVLPTSNETSNMLSIFAPKENSEIEKEAAKKKTETQLNNSIEKNNTEISPIASNSVESNKSVTNELAESNSNTAANSDSELLVNIGDKIILTEEEAIWEVQAIPLYFPMSYSLVKPYVKGFELNNLDAPLLKNVEIDNNWQPKSEKNKS